MCFFVALIFAIGLKCHSSLISEGYTFSPLQDLVAVSPVRRLEPYFVSKLGLRDSGQDLAVSIMCVTLTWSCSFLLGVIALPSFSTASGCICSLLATSHMGRGQKHWSWSSSRGWQSVNQFVWVSGLPLGPLTRGYLALLFRLTITLFFVRRHPLWRENGSVVHSAITH
jgi:hypothetical protein